PDAQRRSSSNHLDRMTGSSASFSPATEQAPNAKLQAVVCVLPPHDSRHPNLHAFVSHAPEPFRQPNGKTMNGIPIFGTIAIILLYLAGSLRVLRQYERGVVFLLGKFESVRGPGLTVIFAPIQQMVRVSLRTVTMQIPSQKIITKDNVSIDIAAVAYYRI